MRIPHLSRLAAPLLIALALPLTAAQAQHWLHDDGTETNNSTGLVMLREHVSGEQAFDEAFGDYAKTWMFKHPQPVDFFRSMDESLGENVAWFWRGWFYTTHAHRRGGDDRCRLLEGRRA